MATRTITYLGLGLLACGALVFVASSGAFDSMSADRGVGVETANDEDAFLGIDYADDGAGDRTVTLTGTDSCNFLGCYYTDTEVLRLEDNLDDTQLNDPTVQFETSGDDLVSAFGDGLRTESSADALAIVRGDFRCPTSGFFDPTQDGAEMTVTMDIDVSGDGISISLERTMTVECVADE